MTEITLDKKTFEALAVDSRIKILKALKQRRKTQAELSKELDLSAPTISEHLNKMLKAKLISKKKQGKKWIYYELTEKGLGIIQPKTSTAFVFALSLAIVLMFIGTYSLAFMQNTSLETTGKIIIQQTEEQVTQTTKGQSLTINSNDLTKNSDSKASYNAKQKKSIHGIRFNQEISIALLIFGLLLLVTAIKIKKRNY